jgi:hypothetical protein
MKDLEIVNVFCSLLQKCILEVDKKYGSDEHLAIVNKLRVLYNDMSWKHQKHLQNWRNVLEKCGLFDGRLHYKINVLDLDKSEDVIVSKEFENAKLLVSEKGNVAFQYNEFSMPFKELSCNEQKMIYNKTMKNVKATEEGIQGKPVNKKQSTLKTWTLPDSQRDWS